MPLVSSNIVGSAPWEISTPASNAFDTVVKSNFPT
jgi:hypothetical protein